MILATHNKCPYCGTSVSPTARYCDNCGTPLKQPDQPTPTRRRERERSRGQVSVWVFIVVLLALFSTGTLGGYRYQAGQWPWEPSLQVTVGNGDPGQANGETAAPNIPQQDGQQKQDPTLQRYLRSVVSINVSGALGSKTGSGFIIDQRGHIVTSAHVIEGFDRCVNVIDDNGTAHLGTVVAWDRNLDVALIQSNTLAKWPDVLTLREAPLVSGDQVYAMNSPKGTPNSALLQAQVEQVGLAKRIDDRYYADLVEFKGATVVHGASGSPLVHRESGQVVGIVTAAADTPIAYAIPTDANLRSLIQRWSAEEVTAVCEAQPASTTTVKLMLATITPLSGTHGVWGNDLVAGAELALRDMENRLLAKGYEVVLSKLDDQGQVSVAKEQARTVVYDQDVIGVVGSFTSQVSAAIAETLAESGLVMIAPTAGADELTERGWPHFNRLVASNARLEAAAAVFAKDRLKARSVLLILDGTAAADGRAESFETTAQIISLPIADRLRLTGSVEVDDLKKQVTEAKADVIYYAGNSQTGFQLVQALRQEGIMLPVIGGTDLYNPAFESLQGPSGQSIYFTHFTGGVDERFRRYFESKLGKPHRGYGMYGYDSARVILEALLRYGEKNPGQVPTRAELAAMVRATREHSGWTSTVTFDPATGENQAAKVYIFEWVNGQPELRE